MTLTAKPASGTPRVDRFASGCRALEICRQEAGSSEHDLTRVAGSPASVLRRSEIHRELRGISMSALITNSGERPVPAISFRCARLPNRQPLALRVGGVLLENHARGDGGGWRGRRGDLQLCAPSRPIGDFRLRGGQRESRVRKIVGFDGRGGRGGELVGEMKVGSSRSPPTAIRRDRCAADGLVVIGRALNVADRAASRATSSRTSMASPPRSSSGRRNAGTNTRVNTELGLLSASPSWSSAVCPSPAE